ncbi:MAG: AMP-binding protein [Nanoarchaeota archaeon]|nr:AMP-binding protein [Nanoarchaeota archaeon]
MTRRLPAVAKEILSAQFIVDENAENMPLPHEKLLQVVAEYDGILSTVSDKLTDDVLQKSQRLKVIANYAVGLDNINLDTAHKKGITVYNTPDVVTNSTADMTFALLFALIRKIVPAQQFVLNNQWSGWNPELFLGEELHGKTWGIIGFGNIGKAVAQRARGFGLNIIYYNRSTKESADKEIIQVSLNTLLKESDYISIHLPLTPETHKMINEETIALMAKKPLLINVARGGIIDTDALTDALSIGKIRGACLDVTDPEPLPSSHPLCKLSNCLIVPHIGTATKECRNTMAKAAAEKIVQHFVQQELEENNGLNAEKIIMKMLGDVFREILKVDHFDEAMSITNSAYWDSLKHIQLLSAIEKKFRITIDFEDTLIMTNVSNIVKVITKYNPLLPTENHSRGNKIIIDNTALRPHQRIDKLLVMEYNNIYELFLAKKEQHPRKEFALFPGQNEIYTYQQFHDKVIILSSLLQSYGIQKGERICLIIPNSSSFVLLYFAALRLGITIVPINPDLSPPEMLYIIKQSQSKIIFYDTTLKNKADEIKQSLEKIELISAQEKIEEYSQRSFAENKDNSGINTPVVNLTDEAVIIYTSGTTGNPKGAVLTHLNLLSDAKEISQWFHFTPETRTLCILPLFHNNGQVITVLTPLYAGGSTVIIPGKSSLLSFWNLTEKYNVNWTSVMPSILSILLSLPGERKDTTMTGIICGGQVLMPEVQKKFEQRFNIPIFEGYGLTETTSFACFNKFPKELRKEGSVGRAFSINEIALFDEKDQELPPHQEGEICIRGLNVVNEYFDLDEKNKTAFRNGWFHSGDFGFKDEEENIYFGCRKDFLIIKGGENIYPSEIENVLFKHQDVAECAVIGIPSKLLGEEIGAFVKLHSGRSTTKEELMNFLVGKLAGFKHPKEWIIIDEQKDLQEIPKGPTKKVLYRKLKEYYLQNINNTEM